MRQVKVLGMIITAACALAMIATATAVAATELPEFSTNPGVAHGTGGAGKLFLEGTAIGCSSSTGRSALYPGSLKLGTFTLDLEGCEQKKKTCWGLTNTLASKEISITGSWHLVPAPGEPKHVLVLSLLTPVHVECDEPEGTLILVSGAVLGLITPYGKSTKKFEGALEVVGTKQKYTKYENDSGADVTAELNGSIDGGIARAAAITSSENKGETENVTELTK